MDRIFIDAKDKNVASYIVYSDGTYAYYDSEKTNKVSASDLEDAFNKGVIINDSDINYKAISLENVDASGSDIAYSVVTFVKTDSGTATTAVLATVRSTNVAPNAVEQPTKKAAAKKPKKKNN